jgi:hypothetical protein
MDQSFCQLRALHRVGGLGDDVLDRYREVHPQAADTASATNHEIICRKHRRLGIRTAPADPSVAASSLGSSVATSFVLRLPIIGARMKIPFSPRLTKRPSEFHVRSPATLVASGFCKAPTHYPCFEHRHDPLSSPSALRCDGDNGAEVFLLWTASSTGGASHWNADSDPRVDAG